MAYVVGLSWYLCTTPDDKLWGKEQRTFLILLLLSDLMPGVNGETFDVGTVHIERL